MEHVVFYPTAEGAPAFRRVASLDDAVRMVETLRNVEGVSEFSVHELTAVPLSVRAYYKVEVPTAVAVPDAPLGEPTPARTEVTDMSVPVTAEAEAASPLVDAVPPQPVEPAAPSLGYFAG